MTTPQESRRGPRLEKFSQKARDVLQRAGIEARKLGQNHIGTEHILLAVSAVDDDTTRETLTRFGVNHDTVLKEVMSMGLDHSSRKRHFEGELNYATRANRVVEQFAPEAAGRRRSPTVEARDILEALKREKESAAVKILQALAPGFEEIL